MLKFGSKNIILGIAPKNVLYDMYEKGEITTKNIVAITYCKYFTFNNNSTVKDLEKELKHN